MSALTDRELLEMAAKLSAYIGTRDRRIANRQRRKGMSEYVSHEDAAKALDSLDDYARMGTGVDAHGPRGVLERYIAQQSATCPPTYRREEAVKALIGKGWTWDGKAWAQPAAQGEAVAWQYRRLDEEEGPSPYWHHMTREQYEMFRDNPRSNCEVRQLFTAPPAQPAERVPDGWVLVPREPTDAMLSCLIDGAPSSWKEGTVAEFYGTREDMAENYKAMLAASPAPSEGGKGVEDAARFRFIVEYNWIGAKTRCSEGIQDGDIESARRAVDRAMLSTTGAAR